MTRPTIPTGLGPRGRRLWRELDAAYDFDAGEHQVAIELCRTVSLADRIETQLASEPLTVVGSQGQPVPNPLIAALAKTRDLVARLTARLSLPDQDLADNAASQLGRLGARRRWHHPRTRAS